VQAADIGCVSQNADTTLAAAALEQIRADIVRRKGRQIIYSYLWCLGFWALWGIGVAALVVLVAHFFLPGLRGYGWLIGGSMVGGWLSVAAGRREVSFNDIPDFLDYVHEPAIRMFFVGVLASIFALFLQLNILPMSVANISLSSFSDPDYIGWAIAIGVIAGIGERALSVQLIARAQNALNPGKR